MAALINRRSLTSTDDDAHIFVLGTAGTHFINVGKLSASGARASTIFVDASNVLVRNFGTLTTSGEAAPAISIGDRGDSISGVSIHNHGRIDSHRDEGSVVGILIDSFGDGAGGNLVMNLGTIDVSTDIGATGIRVLDDGSSVINRGTITARGEIAVGISILGSGNSGANHGTIIVTGEAADGVRVIGADNLFTNWGTIEARSYDTFGVVLQSLAPGLTPSGTLINHGTISGAWASVWGSDGAETVINSGSLVGDVMLHSGDDRYVAARGGTLDGSVWTGEGNDLIVIESHAGVVRIEDFQAGLATDDVIDLAALGIASFAGMMDHATEGASGVTLNFGSARIVLTQVTLASLSPDDFLFDSAATVTAFHERPGAVDNLSMA